METYDFGDGNEYYFLEDFFKVGHEDLKGCRNCRAFVKKKGFVYDVEYFLACKRANEWIALNENAITNNAKVFIRTDCINANEIYSKAPPVIRLNECEELQNKSGKVMQIEVRGERNKGGIYFKANDIGKCLEVQNLIRTILDKRTGYKTQTHHVYFSVNGKKTMFLTYQGFLKAINKSNKSAAVIFRKWAADILQIHHLGTKEQKQELAANLLEMKVEHLITALKKAGTKVAAIYILNLGRFGDIRKKLSLIGDYDDNLIIRKYGMTDDISRRLGEHKRDFKKIYDIDISVEIYYIIDVKYISSAETDVNHYLIRKRYMVEHKKHTEFFAFEKDFKEDVLSMFELISSRYSVNSSTLITHHAKESREIVEKTSKKVSKAKKNLYVAEKRADQAVIALKDLEIRSMKETKVLEDKIRALEEENRRLKTK